MSHDGDLGREDRLYGCEPAAPAFELDCDGARPNELGGVASGVERLQVVSHPRQVADDECSRAGTGNSRDVVHHVFDPDVQRVLVAEHDLGESVTDEDDVHAGSIDETSPRLVVGGDHDDGVIPVAPLTRPYRRHGHLFLFCHLKPPSRPAHSGCRRFEGLSGSGCPTRRPR